ncbi:orotidine-5'-phosphate decarboxylase [Campylobacter hyointestinalis]|uniref:orotidine-5'-phosphate decarboxylase n=1 Tax=Campylobacter hyointestinalis TaxID=198 RepID=UPI000726506E|nr:orotidine-5'-phosphate decarboxylase [Campylobacter hyointestinalis]PPB65860.1 orotidine-5'-phosphate decarboxylase [Campylobacter hyointestinalis subsp. hyointestinalis]CUU89264.1 orotidine 5'-phosphate decarboxylase [Campylobacter hyointestinalis subsp. hyointestinalis]
MKLCVALDLASYDECIKLINELKGLDVWLKVGLRSYLRDGAKFIEDIKKTGDFKIFLDLKIYDIPNTMADACEVISKIGVDMINLHASAGKIAMDTVMDRLAKLEHRPIVLAVSALTSFDEAVFKQIYSANIKDSVVNFSKIAYKCGLDGMVCSVYESLLIKDATSREFLTLTPGIRPFGEAINDQKRVANLDMAKESLSDFIVVGRPIYEANDPREITQKILTKISDINLL